MQIVPGMTARLTNQLADNDLGKDFLRDLVRSGWRLDQPPTFWDLAKTEITWQLSEGVKSSLLDTDVFTNPVARKIEGQLLGRHARYENSVLVRDLFQCFHRSDGMFTP